MQGQSAPAPIRGSTKKGAEENGEDAEEQEDDGGAGAVDVMDLLPRSDIRYQTDSAFNLFLHFLNRNIETS